VDRGAPQEAAVIGAAALLSRSNWLLKVAVNRERRRTIAGVLEHASGSASQRHAFGAMLLFASSPRSRPADSAARQRAAVVASCLGWPC
jgi:hypothetical protein